VEDTNSQSITSRGWVMDLMQSIANDLATVNHLKERLYSTMRDVAPDDPFEKRDREYIEKTIQCITDTRRKKMKLLEDQFLEFDDKMHCAVKHQLESLMEMMEVYDAYPESVDLLQESWENWASVISFAFGVELTDCARCLLDQLK